MVVALPEVQKLVDALRSKYKDRFRDELPGPPPPRPSDITLDLPSPDKRPDPRMMFRKVHHSPPEAAFLERYFGRLQQLGLVRLSPGSPYNSPLFCVPKDLDNPNPDKHYRPVIDPRAVNALFERKSTTLPQIPDAIQRVASSRFATVVDLLAGFHQVRLPEELRKFLTFTMPDGRRLEWCVWPFGFINSPYAMEAMVNELIKGLNNVVAYVDDVAIFTPDSTRPGESPEASFSRDLETHVRSVENFLDRCRRFEVFLSGSKAQLISPVVDILGARVEVGKAIMVLPSRAEELASAPVPHNVKTLEKVLGSFGYVASAIPSFAERVAPLRRILRLARALDRRRPKGGPRPSHCLFP